MSCEPPLVCRSLHRGLHPVQLLALLVSAGFLFYVLTPACWIILKFSSGLQAKGFGCPCSGPTQCCCSNQTYGLKKVPRNVIPNKVDSTSPGLINFLSKPHFHFFPLVKGVHENIRGYAFLFSGIFRAQLFNTCHEY